MSRLISRLVAVRVTAAYAIALGVVAAVLLALGPGMQESAVARMSTNLHNLAIGRLDTLVGSAFVTDGGDVYLWLPGLACLLAFGELIWRGRRMVFAFALGHVGATVVVAVWLVVAVAQGWLPGSIADASDVGISYGAASVLGALTGALPVRCRPAWIGWWVMIAVLPVAASEQDFTALGHLLSLLMGVLLSLWFRAGVQWTAPRLVLFVVGISYCYSLLAGASLIAPIAGLLGALFATALAWAWRRVRALESGRQPGAAALRLNREGMRILLVGSAPAPVDSR